MEGLASGEEPEAEFKGEDSELVSGTEGSREGFPVDGFNHDVRPLESLMHVGFEEAESVLTANRGREFASHGDSAKRELYFSGGKEGHKSAGGRELMKLVGGKDVGITV